MQRKLDGDLLENIEREAFEGQRIWLLLKEKYEVSSKDSLVILEKQNKTLNVGTLEKIPEYLRRKGLERAIVLTDDFKLSTKYSCIHVRYLESDEINKIKRFYRAVQFATNIVYVSLESPFGTSGMIGKDDISIEDYIKDALLV